VNLFTGISDFVSDVAFLFSGSVGFRLRNSLELVYNILPAMNPVKHQNQAIHVFFFTYAQRLETTIHPLGRFKDKGILTEKFGPPQWAALWGEFLSIS